MESTTPGLRRRFKGASPEERQAERRNRLIAAGLETFGKHGFHAIGVRDVCAEARLTERYFYESFKNREQLFLATYQCAVRQIQEAITSALACGGAEPAGLARAGLRAALRGFQDD